MGDNLFTATSPLGYTVECSRKTWNIHVISEEGHYIMKGNEEVVKKTITEPIKIYESSQTPERHVYFGESTCASYNNDYYTKVIVVCKNDKNTANLVTTFPTEKMRGGINEERVLYDKKDNET